MLGLVIVSEIFSIVYCYEFLSNVNVVIVTFILMCNEHSHCRLVYINVVCCMFLKV